MGWRGRAVVAVVIALAGVCSAAGAATSTGIASWTPLDGTGGAFTTTMQLPGLGYPQADVTSDSRAGSVGVQSGATTWFGATSPPGARFGSSRDLPYLNLRPRADNATSPSVTTYTFARATPTGWGFVLGDIDSDQVSIAATLADGSPATVADLGFQGVFNLCATTPKPSGCSSPQAKDTPTWNATTATLRGNAGADDTYGADGWFEPTAALKTLTFTYTWRSGFPVYQTWFAARAQDVSGRVSVSGGTCAVTGVAVRLLAADGTVLATTSPAGDGSYGFDQVAATDGFTVHIGGLPADCTADGATSRSIDLRTADATADFSLHQVIPGQTGEVAGHVTDADSGDPVADADLTVTGPEGFDKTVSTESDGGYLLTDLAAGDYMIVLTPPAGTEAVGPTERDVTITDAGETFDAEDFQVRPVPALPGEIGGQVTEAGSGDPVPGADLEVTGPGGYDETVSTGSDGTYGLPDLPSGDYAIDLTPPAGTEAVGPTERDVTITDAGETFDAEDFRVRPVPATGGGPGTGTPVPPTSGSAGVLPDTGGPEVGLLPLGLGLLLGGAGCMFLSRRQRAALGG